MYAVTLLTGFQKQLWSRFRQAEGNERTGKGPDPSWHRHTHTHTHTRTQNHTDMCINHYKPLSNIINLVHHRLNLEVHGPSPVLLPELVHVVRHCQLFIFTLA